MKMILTETEVVAACEQYISRKLSDPAGEKYCMIGGHMSAFQERNHQHDRFSVTVDEIDDEN